ncbi:MAG: DUF1488 family protein [Betaproteobacteria bacterium]|nr:DUF1488 family protein [Betaproteobacteria bacterium]
MDRCASAAFGASFPQNGVFIPKTIKGRRYWYFQSPSSEGRTQKYVGPETPELLKQIDQHKNARDDERERRALVSTIVRSLGLPRPNPQIANVTAALAKAGVFRLRAVLVGTVAYQTYSAMLGIKLPVSIQQTGDVDIAQFANVSAAVGDRTSPILDILKEVDKTFAPVPTIHKGHVTSYAAKGGLRVDFLTPNEGRDTDKPQPLQALQTDAQPLRYLNFLIYEPEPAVVLHDAGIYVTVPAPHRYAVHKLIISRLRSEGVPKRDKDIQQVEALLEFLWQKRPYELKSAWEEAYGKGKEWRRHLIEGMSELTPRVRDGVLKVIDRRRDFIPGLDLTFNNTPPRYDFDRHVITFAGNSMGGSVQCEITSEALNDLVREHGRDQKRQIEIFIENRSAIEKLARTKYLSFPIEEPGSVLIK